MRKIIALSFAIFFGMIVFFMMFRGTIINIERKIITEKAITKIGEKNVSDYKCKDFLTAKIYYTDADKDFIDMINLTVATYKPILDKEFELKANKPTIIVYPTDEELNLALKGKITQTPMGIYYGGVIHILSPNCFLKKDKNQKSEYLKNGPILHEMVHYYIDLKTNGQYYVWFSEGLALYYEYKYLGYEWCSSLNGKVDDITISQLKNKFYSLDEKKAYRRSFELIRDEIEKNQSSSIPDLCNRNKKTI